MKYSFSARNRGTRNNPKWQVILSYQDESGKWKQKSKGGFYSRADALSQPIKENLLRSINVTNDKKLLDMTLEEFVKYYCEERHLSYNTQLIYKYTLKAFSALKDIPVRNLSQSDFKTVIKEFKQSTSTINRRIEHVNTIMKFAKKMKVVSEYTPIEKIKVKHKESINVLTDDELKFLLDYMKTLSPYVYIPVFICAYTGCRIGECLGLTWNDINFEKKTIDINKQYGETAHGMDFKPCKTANSVRTVPIPDVLLNLLKNYKENYPINEENRVVRNKTVPDISGRVRKIVGHGIHCLRHTYATKLLRHGMDIKTVSALLGDTVKTVIETYVNYTEDMRKKASKDIHNIFDK